MLSDAKLAPSPDRLAAVRAAWANLTASGPTLTSAERIGVINAARAAWAGEVQPDAGLGPLGEAAHWLAIDAGGLTAQVVDDLEARGLDRWRYLEVVGVVARTSNVDFYARGLGASLPAVPEPDGAPPSRAIHADAGITDGWVPATGPLMAPFSLDALPSEGDALRSLHEPMYMPMRAMGDSAYGDELSRAQIEYLAARSSYLNECFY